MWKFATFMLLKLLKLKIIARFKDQCRERFIILRNKKMMIDDRQMIDIPRYIYISTYINPHKCIGSYVCIRYLIYRDNLNWSSQRTSWRGSRAYRGTEVKGMGKFLTIYHISMFGFFTWHLKYHKTAIICLKESYEKIFKMLYEEMVWEEHSHAGQRSFNIVSPITSA